MKTENATVQQAIDLIKELSPQEQNAVAKAIEADRDAWWEERVDRGEQQLRQLCAQQGLHWDDMTEEEREEWIDESCHSKP